MTRFLHRWLEAYIRQRQLNGSGAFLDDARKYWLLAPPFLRAGGSVPVAYMSGARTLDWLETHVPLNMSWRVLDAGCGGGRVSGAFARRGDAFSGSYHGFDIDRRRIEQLQILFRGRSRFEFTHADVFHSYYNENGSVASAEFIYPYEDNSFDLVFFNSIFTHMASAAIAAGLREASRCLDRNGRIWATFYCLDKDYCPASSMRTFEIEYDEGFTSTPENAEGCVAFAETVILSYFDAAGLAVEGYIPGHWKKTRQSCDQHEQDVFVLRHL